LTSYTAHSVFERFCVPAKATDFALISKVFSKYSIENHIESISASKYLILISVGIALLISFVFSYLLEKCAGVVVTLALVGFYAAAGYLSYISWKGMNENKDFGENDALKRSKYKLYRGLLGFLAISIAILSCMICCFWSRLILAVKVISAAAEFVSETKRVIFVPIVMLVITCAYLGFWTLITCYIYSTAQFVKDIPNDVPFVPLDITNEIRKTMYFHGIGLFWNLALLLTISNFIITGATCLWYHKDHSNNKNLLTTTITWMIRYHFGTIAFGSFILAVVWILRVIADYLEVKIVC